jgi:hypothetical protein
MGATSVSYLGALPAQFSPLHAALTAQCYCMSVGSCWLPPRNGVVGGGVWFPRECATTHSASRGRGATTCPFTEVVISALPTWLHPRAPSHSSSKTHSRRPIVKQVPPRTRAHRRRTLRTRLSTWLLLRAMREASLRLDERGQPVPTPQ